MAARSLDEARLAAVIAEVLHRHPAGGLAVGVVGRDGPEFFEGFGVADAGPGTPIAQDTVFRIGSISKTFTAIAVMQLRERGLVDLDDPVSEHLRSYRLAPADAQLLPGFADMLVSAPAAAAGAAAEHGVAGDPAADPARVDPLARRRDGPGPLVAEPDRELGVAVVEVGHLAGEELDIGPAHPGPLDIDDDLTGPRDGRVDLLDASLPRGGDHEGPHRCGAHRPDDVMGR
jgi:hypothetical protein